MNDDIIIEQLKVTFPFDTIINVDGHTSMSEFSYNSENITQIKFSSADNTLMVKGVSGETTFDLSQIKAFTTDCFSYVSHTFELNTLRIIDFKVVG